LEETANRLAHGSSANEPKPKTTTAMKITTQEGHAEQVRRLAAKTQDQRMVNEVIHGTSMSP
jgi:hypothetical protein